MTNATVDLIGKLQEILHDYDDSEVQTLLAMGEAITKIAGVLLTIEDPQERRRILRASAELFGVEV